MLSTPGDHHALMSAICRSSAAPLDGFLKSDHIFKGKIRVEHRLHDVRRALEAPSQVVPAGVPIEETPGQLCSHPGARAGEALVGASPRAGGVWGPCQAVSSMVPAPRDLPATVLADAPSVVLRQQ